MTPPPFDVLVIGGGVAGAAAALAAAAAGARVGLVRAAPGATALAAGGWRGPLPGRLGAALAGAGLAHERGRGPLPHPTGRLEPADFAPRAQRAAVLESGAMVCGITGLPGFHAPTLARLWGAAAGLELHHALLDLRPATPAAGWSPVALAAALDRDPAILAAPLTQALAGRRAGRTILPAVLGLERPEPVHAALEAAVGAPVGEALGMPPSAPGWRLDRALRAAVQAAGVEVILARVIEPQADGRLLEAVLVEQQVNGGSPAGEQMGPAGGRARPIAEAPSAPPASWLFARTFILATGKFAGGGIVADPVFAEPALGCPVWVEHLDEVFTDAEPLALTHLERSLPQPLLRAGVGTDEEGRPVNRKGNVVYENVRAAGTVRAGWEAAAAGLGAAAVDGWRAGERAAAEAAGVAGDAPSSESRQS
ncbi:MAG: FAD-binding protein [Gemmatimonadetes bacterium]|nr:FAD-binding protein [Gemmatimonadota bacterium]